MPTNEELEGMLLAMRTEMTGLRTRIAELEDFAQTHIGLDWGQAGVSANASHPNISADSIETGGGIIRQDLYGMQVQSSLPLDPEGAIYFVERLSPNPETLTTRAALYGYATTAGVALQWQVTSNGSSSINFQRTAAGVPTLSIHDIQITLGDGESPAQITANQNDYSPTGITTTTVLRLSSDAARDITGITGGSSGRILILLNVGAFNITLKDDTTSTAENRFQLNGDIVLGPDESVWLWYDSTSSRWRA